MISNLDPANMTGFQRYVPLLGKIHRGGVGFLVLDKADAHNDLVFVSQEEANRLKPASVSRPPSCARNASGEAFVTVSV